MTIKYSTKTTHVLHFDKNYLWCIYDYCGITGMKSATATLSLGRWLQKGGWLRIGQVYAVVSKIALQYTTKQQAMYKSDAPPQEFSPPNCEMPITKTQQITN